MAVDDIRERRIRASPISYAPQQGLAFVTRTGGPKIKPKRNEKVNATKARLATVNIGNMSGKSLEIVGIVKARKINIL